jgi:hypothetical protein
MFKYLSRNLSGNHFFLLMISVLFDLFKYIFLFVTYIFNAKIDSNLISNEVIYLDHSIFIYCPSFGS